MKKSVLLGVLGLMALFRMLRSAPAAPARATQEPAPHRFVGLLFRHPWLSLAALLVVLAGGGAVVLVSGVVPIKASSGHWTATKWFLQFAKARSVATHSAFINAPRLADPALVLRGAGHYEMGCRPCHGAPGAGLPKIAASMTPSPPDLTTRVPRWSSEHLFYIVKHGVKFTGMPAWPARQRDDEVWAMVAFLRTLPALTEQEYRRLVFRQGEGEGDTAALESTVRLTGAGPPRAVIESCARCHGFDGRGRGIAAFPRLDGQREQYLENALHAFARGERFSGTMGPIAAALPAATIQEVALYYGGVTSPAGGIQEGRGLIAQDGSAVARGEAIATRGIPSQDVPSCADCHGPAPRNPAYPILSGQYAEYLVQQLELLQARRRGGSPYVRLMHAFVDRLTPEQIRDVAHYYSLQPVVSLLERGGG